MASFGNAQAACPCGSGLGLDACCGPVVSGERVAVTAQELMRSRYTAYAIGDADHVFRSWHPGHRPANLTLDPSVRWTSLDVLDAAGGGATDDTGEVEFRARYVDADGPGELRERSLFTRRAGRWVYLHAS